MKDITKWSITVALAGFLFDYGGEDVPFFAGAAFTVGACVLLVVGLSRSRTHDDAPASGASPH